MAMDGEKVKLICSECGSIFQGPLKLAGKEKLCPKCGKSATFQRESILPTIKTDSSSPPPMKAPVREEVDDVLPPTSSLERQQNQNDLSIQSRKTNVAISVPVQESAKSNAEYATPSPRTVTPTFYEYKCISGPLSVIVKPGQEATAFDVYAEIINSEALQGFELDCIHRVDVVAAPDAPGCLGAILQALGLMKRELASSVTHNLLIFRKPRT